MTIAVLPTPIPSGGVGGGGGGGGGGTAVDTFTLKVEVAFNDSVWSDSPTWTDITQYVQQVNTTMGRQHELQQVNPSTAVITLWNGPAYPADTTGGRFSPWNTNSAYYNSGTGLTPGHPVRIRAKIGSVNYDVFYGYTQSWVPSYGQTSSTVTLNCYDGMALLNLAMMDVNLYEPRVLLDGATAYWQCQDPVGSQTFADATGNGHTGLLWGGGTFGGNAGALRAIADSSVAFTGGGLLATPITAPSVTHVMFEGWFQTTGTNQVFMAWSPYTGTVDTVNLYADSSGYLALGYALSATWPGSAVVWINGPKVNDGQWHHLVVEVPVTDSAGAYAVWMDGVGIGFYGAGPTYAWSTLLAFSAGGYWTETNATDVLVPHFTGSMDQVAYYQTPLTQAQILNHYELGSAGFVVQDSGERVGTVILDLAGVPSDLILCDAGVVNVQGATSSLTQTTVSSYLQQVTNTERGILYQDPTGVLQFKNRWHVYTNTHSVESQITFSYVVSAGNQQYLSQGLTPQIDDTDLWNDINVGRQGGIVQDASDAASIAAFGRRSLQGYTSLLFENDSDANDLAQGLLYQYKEPKPRVRAINLSSLINAASALPLVLALNLLDRVSIVWRPLDGSTVDFDQQSLVEQVSHSITANPPAWNTTLAVTPIGTEQFFLVGDAVNGIVGTSLIGF